MGLEIRDLALHAGPIVLQLLDFKKTWAYFVHNFFLHKNSDVLLFVLRCKVMAFIKCLVTSSSICMRTCCWIKS